MGGGNGAKAAQKRDRNAKNAAAKKGDSSQLKSNAASKTIACKICFTTFQSTMKKPQLEEHAQNKHSKNYDDCFDEAN
ncbi:MAG: hypothetical protein GOMPHAMPRED_005738 [Gomphillus americanus]|uniref:Uncharacterized protein n=1 Tax=Gomphillus americanus TaxID=1940652 RepID=A0A8H3IJX4_9LECA|nr:MAG: hypothetical protein GOMPHAMPRED_005738 [Gomphillus americanus]